MYVTLPSRLIGTITTAAVALTAFTAAPAYADDDRTARAIATILGLAVVGKIIHDSNKRRETVSGPVYQVNPNSRGHGYAKPQPRYYPEPRYKPEPQYKPLPRRVSRKLLPQNCLRSFQTRHGQVRMFGRRCLERNYDFVNRLPHNCAQQIRTDRGTRSGFDARCLRNNGYRLARG